MIKAYEKLVIAALNNDVNLIKSLPTINWKNVYEFSIEHNLDLFVFDFYESLWSSKFKKTKLYDLWKKEYIVNVFDYSAAIRKSEKILDKLREANIDYLRLKGDNLQRLYPNPKVRISGDIDILVEQDQIPRAHQLLKDLGFKVTGRSLKDASYTQEDYITFELHSKSLEPEFFEHAEWFDSLIFERKFYDEELETYRIAHNEELVYLIAHCVKHYSYMGSGLRNLYDIKLYINKYRENIDFEIVFNNLNRLKCLKYSVYVLEMCNRLFNLNLKHGYKINEDYLDLLLRETFVSGMHGVEIYRNGISSFMASDSNKRSKLLFLDYETMKKKYPILIKHRGLLPVYWIKRLVHVLWARKKVVLDYFKHNKAKSTIDERYKVNEFLKQNDLLTRDV